MTVTVLTRAAARVCLTAILGATLLPPPAAARPATPQPAAVQPAEMQPALAQPAAVQPALAQQLVPAQPAAVQPQPEAGQPASTSPSPSPSPSATRDASTIGDIAPDRPGLGDGSAIVGRGVWQLEAGWSFESVHEEGAVLHELALPLALFRLGVTDRFELRFGADGLLSDTSSSPGSRRMSGRSDVEVGAKVKLIESADAGFELSVLPIVSLPIGSSTFTSGGYDPTVEVAWTQSLPRGFSLSGNVTAASVSAARRRFTQHILTVSVDRDVAGGWNGFAEAFRASSFVRDGTAVWIVDTGATHRLGRQAQFDISVGRGVSATAPDWFISAGISLRGFLTHGR